MTHIRHRNNITDILRPHSIGCELGVFEGDFAERLWSSGKFDKLYLVDLFSGPAWNFDKHYSDASVLYDVLKNRFSNYQNIRIIKEDSLSFLRSSKIVFDFIYIDTVHSYEHLIQELEAAHKITKPCGYICGHDYCSEFNGVIDAVTEFCENYKYKTIITEEQYASFIIHINRS